MNNKSNIKKNFTNVYPTNVIIDKLCLHVKLPSSMSKNLAADFWLAGAENSGCKQSLSRQTAG